jgi:shikimate kinase
MPSSLILVGPMGAGKTTIGRLLAQELHLTFKDIDQIISERAGADIPWIFHVEGEEGFRKREHHVLEDVLSESTAVVATGGGIVVNEANRQLLRSNKHCIVYLCASVEQQYVRTSKDKNRPLLQNDDPKFVLKELMTMREPWYREIADLVIDTDSSKPKIVVNTIIDYWKNHF